MTLEGAVPKHQSNARFLLLTLLTLILVLTRLRFLLWDRLTLRVSITEMRVLLSRNPH